MLDKITETNRTFEQSLEKELKRSQSLDSQSYRNSPRHIALGEAPADPILGLVGRFKADPAEKKAET